MRGLLPGLWLSPDIVLLAPLLILENSLGQHRLFKPPDISAQDISCPIQPSFDSDLALATGKSKEG
jgi:hypothetical protein